MRKLCELKTFLTSSVNLANQFQSSCFLGSNTTQDSCSICQPLRKLARPKYTNTNYFLWCCTSNMYCFILGLLRRLGLGSCSRKRWGISSRLGCWFCVLVYIQGTHFVAAAIPCPFRNYVYLALKCNFNLVHELWGRMSRWIFHSRETFRFDRADAPFGRLVGSQVCHKIQDEQR